MSKVTMKDIAKKLNISINAVSIALNEKPGVNDEMRIQILKTADELGYINEKKKYLSALSKSSLCILMRSYYTTNNHFYSIVLQSIIEEARDNGYYSIMNYFDDQHFLVPQCVVDRKVAGILVVGKIAPENLKILKSTGIPVVLVDSISLYDNCDAVLTHNKQGGYLMTSYVLQKDYKKIGFFGDLDYSISFLDRYMGYRFALSANGIVDIDEYVSRYSLLYHVEELVVRYDVEGIMRMLRTIELPEVFVCCNDQYAYLLILALKQMGLRVPEDIGVTGFDNSPMSVQSIPQITTVHVQKELMGKVAVNKLIERINRYDDICVTELLNVQLVERQSLK